jgi:DNA-binding LacI/PurR family transcriptional regulator
MTGKPITEARKEARAARPTVTTIAEHLGLSRSTVTGVLTGRAAELRIRPETQRRVLEVAQELGYHPNALARSVRSGKSHMIGYLVNDPHYEPYWNTIIGALAEAEASGFTLKLLSVDSRTLGQRVEQCMQLRLAGVIARVTQDPRSLFEAADRAALPVVMVDQDVPRPFGVRVAADDSFGCRAAVSHLVGLGHRRIAFLSHGFDAAGITLIPERERLFLEEMAARGLEVPPGYVARETMLVYGPETADGLDPSTVAAATDSLLSHPAGRPTALFCWRDETALIAIRACRRAGLRVPEDISVVGFSDIRAAQLSDPTLTTCRSPWEEMGRTAVRQLVQALEADFDPSPRTVLLPSGFVARESSGPAPA